MLSKVEASPSELFKKNWQFVMSTKEFEACFTYNVCTTFNIADLYLLFTIMSWVIW